MKTKAILLLVAISSFSLVSRAATINFGSQVPSTGKYSDNSDWLTDGSFHFEVGVFSTVFTPTSLNVSQWMENWTIANMGWSGATTWLDDGGDTSFVGNGGYTTNAGAWAIGSKIYMWGFNSRANGINQWILLQNATTWLTVDSGTTSPQDFVTFSSGTSAVVGSVNGAGDAFQSASVNVVPEPATWMFCIFGSTMVLLFGYRRSSATRIG